MEKENTSPTKNNGLASWLQSSKAIYIIIAIAVMAVISLAYFYPDAMQGNVLRQHDIAQGVANGQEAQEFKAETGETTWWTNSLFSGMPMFQIAPSYKSSGLLSWINDVYGLWLPTPANLLFMMMIGFFILLMACRTRWYIALIGAIAYAFSSYFIIIIGAGHIWKFLTLTYVPPTIAGIIWCYRGKYLTGGTVAALFATLQISSNHPQMTYYFLFLIAAIAIGYLIKAIMAKQLKQWGIATVILAVAAALAVLANSPNLYNTYEYSKETMRGGHSELATATPNSTNGGLDRDYITAWSYGVSETFTLLIPNVDGGATLKPVAGSNKMLSLADTEQAKQMLNDRKISSQDYQYLTQFPQYFGDQPMTNGPVYVGALIFALFIIGCIIINSPVIWAVLAATILTVMLSWGHNFMWLTNLFIDHFPMYNKFRTVSSILVVAELTMPLIAMLALQKILFDKNFKPWQWIATYVTLGVCALVCLIIYWFPNVFNLFSQQEADFFAQGYAQQFPTLYAAIANVRADMIATDALRSLLIIAIGTAALYLAHSGKVKPTIIAAVIGVVVLVDLYTVNKRYLSSESFTRPTKTNEEQFFAKRPVDETILQDTAMNYRVIDIPLFEDAMPSYYHKSVGGYHAAKLSRYQDLMSRQIDLRSGNVNIEVLNMLNTKYIITSNTEVSLNPDARGNAWFVDNIKYVATPNEEMDFLNNFNAATNAVADRKYESALGSSIPAKMPNDTIFETSYAPNRLTYHAQSQNGGLAVFSEIYFPWGWKATIDGNEAPIGRVNYVLRALRIPAGSHTVEFTFEPQSVTVTETLAYISIIIIYLAVIASIILTILKKKCRE